jgi:hypothetical protein
MYFDQSNSKFIAEIHHIDSKAQCRTTKYSPDLISTLFPALVLPSRLPPNKAMSALAEGHPYDIASPAW